jgi:hypothetical protein
MTTQKAIRAAFWAAHPALIRRRHRYGWSDSDKTAELVHHVDSRMAFVDYVDALARDGVISSELAQRATL